MVWDIAGRLDEYLLPRRASLLAGDERLRRDMLKWVLRHADGKLDANGLTGARVDGLDRHPDAVEAECDIMEGAGLLHILRYLTLCTATVKYNCRSDALSRGAGEAWFDEDARHTDVENGVAIAAVVMCGGLSRRAGGGPNARLTVRMPKLCGGSSGRGCGRYIPGNRSSEVCVVCRSTPYMTRAEAGFFRQRVDATRAGGMTGHRRAHVQNVFPSTYAVFGPAPPRPDG